MIGYFAPFVMLALVQHEKFFRDTYSCRGGLTLRGSLKVCIGADVGRASHCRVPFRVAQHVSICATEDRCLCGRGEISMESSSGLGDEERIGGVIASPVEL